MRVVSNYRTLLSANSWRRRFQLMLHLFAWIFLAVTSLFIVAHGCHKSDEDHEPMLIPDDSSVVSTQTLPRLVR